MSFLKNIMSTFVEFKDEATSSGSSINVKDKSAARPRIPNASDAAGTTAPIPTPSVTVSKATARSDYHKYFEDLIEDANTRNPLFQGTDFKEFIDSKIDVEAIADEATRYKTAFNVLRRTGLTKDRLVSTGREYITIIDNDLRGFTDAYSQQYKKDVEQNELLLQKKAAELQELNEKIAALSSEIKKVSNEITQSKDQLTSNRDAFISAGENKKKEIEAELQKISQYF